MLLQNPSIFFGLSFGEILSVLALMGGLITAYTSLNVRIAKLETHQKQFEVNRSEILTNIETNRKETNSLIETIRTENRDDHSKIFDALQTFKINK